MKKTLFFVLATIAILSSCTPQNPDMPNSNTEVEYKWPENYYYIHNETSNPVTVYYATLSLYSSQSSDKYLVRDTLMVNSADKIEVPIKSKFSLMPLETPDATFEYISYVTNALDTVSVPLNQYDAWSCDSVLILMGLELYWTYSIK